MQCWRRTEPRLPRGTLSPDTTSCWNSECEVAAGFEKWFCSVEKSRRVVVKPPHGGQFAPFVAKSGFQCDDITANWFKSRGGEHQIQAGSLNTAIERTTVGSTLHAYMLLAVHMALLHLTAGAARDNGRCKSEKVRELHPEASTPNLTPVRAHFFSVI